MNIIARILACAVLFMVFPIGAFADTEEDSANNGKPIVEYRCLSDIEAGNRLALQMWETARAKELDAEAKYDIINALSRTKGSTNYYNKVTSKTQSFKMPNGKYAQITFTATKNGSTETATVYKY